MEKRWNDALDFLELHLDGEIDPEELGRLAGCSAYHFQRMFSYLAEVPLSEYIRRRRMSRAAMELQQGAKVLDVALKYGYESPTAFNRAFQAVHGLPPSAAQRTGTQLLSFPPIRFKFVLKGATAMEYQIVTREAFRIIGLRVPLPTEAEESFDMVPKFWAEAGQRIPELLELVDQEPEGILGVSTCHRDKDNFYYIAVSSGQEPPEGMYAEEVPACTWAVFSGSGLIPEAIQELQKRIVSEWLPDSGCEWAQAPDVEVYLTPPGAADSRFQVWLPVVQKKN